MFNRIVLLLALAALLGAAATQAATIQNKRVRAYTRYTYFVEQLQKDELSVYEKYGYPYHRIRVYAYGEIVEHWTYYEYGLEFVFDQNSNLIETRSFWPEDRRERMELFPKY